jgi:hypothetical protein
MVRLPDSATENLSDALGSCRADRRKPVDRLLHPLDKQLLVNVGEFAARVVPAERRTPRY